MLGTGTTSADLAIGGRTLTFAGGAGAPTWGTDSNGDAAIILGTALANPLALASALALAGNQSWSLAWRAKQASDSDNQGAIAGTGAAGGFVSMFGSSNYLGVRPDAGGDADFTSQTVFTTEANYLLVWDEPNGYVHLYKNGAEVAGSPVSIGGGSFPLTIDRLGNGYSGTVFSLVGSISYVYAWANYAATPADAAALHANPYRGLTTSPVIYQSPTFGHPGRTVTLRINGFMSNWLAQSPAGLFSISGGTGASLGVPTIVSDTLATVSLTTGSALGTLTITDNSTGATTTFDVRDAFVGGIQSSTFAADSSVSGGDATGRSFVPLDPAQRIRQHGPITRVLANVEATGGPNSWRFQVRRPNTSNPANLDFVSQSELITPAGTGLQSFALSSPMACQPGDVLGVFLIGTAAIRVKNSALSPSIGYDAANQTGANWAPGNSLNLFSLCLDYRCPSVLAIDSGDSRSAGHNGASYWYTHYEGGPRGNLAAQPIHALQALCDATRTAWPYQNFAMGSQTWQHIAETQFPDIFVKYGLAPQHVFTQIGVNDKSLGRTNSAMLVNADTCYALLPDNTIWWIDETLAWTAGDDVQAAEIRSYNTALQAWAAGKPNVRIVSCHGQMASVRVSTGQLDDMASAYNADGVHLSAPAGVNKLAELRNDALNPAPIVLIGANSTQGGSSASGAVVQAHLVSAAPSAQAATSSSGAVMIAAILAGASCVQVNGCSTGAVTGPIVLAGASCSQANACSASAVTVSDGSISPDVGGHYTVNSRRSDAWFWGACSRFDDKRPAERLPLKFDFRRYATGIAASPAPVFSVRRLAGADDPSPSLMLDGPPALSGTIVQQWVVGGVPGCRYLWSCTITRPDGAVLVLESEMVVRS